MSWQIVSSPFEPSVYATLSEGFRPNDVDGWSQDDYAEVVLHHDNYLVEEGRPNYSISISHVLMEYHRDKAGLRRPFSNGSQYGDWTAANCENCSKQEDCEIATALSLAYCTSGLVRDGIALRMGAIKNAHRYNWPCPEAS
jgi:hypothetical protein